MKAVFYILTFAILSSCAFNKSFFQPTPGSSHTPPDAQTEYIPYGDGEDSVHAFFYARENPLASIFILHGEAGNLQSWGEVADLFYQAGYQVFIFDFPGYGVNAEETNFESVFESTQAAVEFYGGFESVKNSKSLLMGFSMGGNLALKVATENDTLFDALLIEGAYNSQKAVAVNHVTRPFKFGPRLFVKNQIKGNEIISQWEKSLLIIHSEDDPVCPYEMGQSLYNNATGTEKKELWTVKGQHLAGLGSNFYLYLEKVQKLMEDS